MNIKSLIFIQAFYFCLFSYIPSHSQTSYSKIKFSNGDYFSKSSKDYIETFKLNEDKYLNIHFDLDKPLIDALKKLDQNASDQV